MTRQGIATSLAEAIVADGWSPTLATRAGTMRSSEWAPSVYWRDEHVELEYGSEWDLVEDFHPSEFLSTSGHVEHHLSGYLDDLESEGIPFVVVCVEVVDPDDLEALVGWALVAKQVA